MATAFGTGITRRAPRASGELALCGLTGALEGDLEGAAELGIGDVGAADAGAALGAG
jgi:hypothetical protein